MKNKTNDQKLKQLNRLILATLQDSSVLMAARWCRLVKARQELKQQRQLS